MIDSETAFEKWLQKRNRLIPSGRTAEEYIIAAAAWQAAVEWALEKKLGGAGAIKWANRKCQPIPETDPHDPEE